MTDVLIGLRLASAVARAGGGPGPGLGLGAGPGVGRGGGGPGPDPLGDGQRRGLPGVGPVRRPGDGPGGPRGRPGGRGLVAGRGAGPAGGRGRLRRGGRGRSRRWSCWRSTAPIRPRFRRRAWAALARRGAVAGATRFGRVSLYAADVLAIGWWAGPSLGPYAAARRVAFALLALGLVVPSAVAPADRPGLGFGRGRGPRGDRADARGADGGGPAGDGRPDGDGRPLDAPAVRRRLPRRRPLARPDRREAAVRARLQRPAGRADRLPAGGLGVPADRGDGRPGAGLDPAAGRDVRALGRGRRRSWGWRSRGRSAAGRRSGGWGWPPPGITRSARRWRGASGWRGSAGSGEAGRWAGWSSRGGRLWVDLGDRRPGISPDGLPRPSPGREGGGGPARRRREGRENRHDDRRAGIFRATGPRRVGALVVAGDVAAGLGMAGRGDRGPSGLVGARRRLRGGAVAGPADGASRDRPGRRAGARPGGAPAGPAASGVRGGPGLGAGPALRGRDRSTW